VSSDKEKRKAIRERIASRIVSTLSLNIDPAKLHEGDACLDQFFGFDSLAVLEVVAALEEEFGIEFEPERLELSLLTDLTRLADYVASRTTCFN
jgi:acyl carrier protein